MKNSKSLLVSAFVLALSPLVQAHIEEGPHLGKTPTGEICEMNAGKQTFVDNMPHPLNERIQVEINGVQFSLQHPPVINAAQGIASFNHDQFQAVTANKAGANAVIVEMAHTPDFEGPTSFTFVDHNWKTGEKKSISCKLDAGKRRQSPFAPNF